MTRDELPPSREESPALEAVFGGPGEAAVERARTEAALRESEARHAFLVRFSDAVRGLADPLAVAETACQLVAERLGVERAYWAEIDWAANDYVIGASVHHHGVYVIAGRFPIEVWAPSTATLLNGQPWVVDDTRTDPRLTPAMVDGYRHIAVGADLAVPVVVDGQLRCTFVANQRLPRHWTPQEVALLQGVADRCWAEVERARADAALRESEEKYRTLFETMGEGFAICDMVRDDAGRYIDYVHVELNEAFERQTGARREQFIGKAFSEMVGPTDFAKWMGFYSRVAATGEPAVVEDYVERHNRWFDVSIYRHAGDRLFMFYRDITERKEREQQQEFLLKFSDDLRTLGDAKTIEETGVRMLAEYLRLDRAYVFVLHPAEDRAVVRSEHRAEHFASIVGEVRMSDFPETVVQIEDKTLVVNDTDSYERLSAFNRASLHAVNLQAFVCASVRKSEKTVIWSLAAVSATPRTWRKAEVDLIEIAAERIWAAAEKARAEQALRASEEKFSALFAASPAPFLIVRPDAPRFTVFEVNDAYLAATMRTRETLAGTGLFEAFPDNPHDPAADGVRNLRASLTRALESGRPDAMPVQKYDIARADGSFEERWWRPVNSPVLNQNGQVQAIIHHVSDVTEEHRADEQRAFLLMLSDALTPLRDVSEIKATASRLLGEHLGVGRAFFAEIDGDDWIVGDAYDDGSSPLEPGRYPAAEYGRWTMDTLRAAGVVAVADTASDARLEPSEREALQRIGNAAVVGVPLVRHGEVVAVLSLHSREPREWTNAELELVQEIANRTWPAVERARVEEALRESEEQFRRSIEEAPIPVIMHAEDGEVLQVSRTWTELTGYARADVPTFDAWLTRAYGEGADDVRAHMHALFSGSRRTMGVDFPMRTRDGDTRHWSFSASAPGTLHDGRRFVVGMALDVTERQRAEEALRASEARYRTLVENVRDYAIFRLAPDGVITEWPSGAERVNGYTAHEVLGKPVSMFYSSEDVAAGVVESEIAEAAATGRAEREGWRLRKGGERFWVNEIMTAIHDGGGRMVGFSKIARDLTDRRRAEEAAERERADRAREDLRRQLAAAEEAERRRLARELHDQLGQQLTGLALGLEEARSLVVPTDGRGDGAPSDGTSPLVRRLDQLQALARDVTMGARYVALELRPPELDDMGFENALETYVREWSARFGVAADVVVTGGAGRALPADAGSALYRIAQEAMNNAAKHARAKNVSIIVEKAPSEVRLVVEDDGLGFDMDTTADRVRRERRLGLAGMRERAALLGGALKVESSPGRGTTVFVRLPLDAAAGPGDAP